MGKPKLIEASAPGFDTRETWRPIDRRRRRRWRRWRFAGRQIIQTGDELFDECFIEATTEGDHSITLQVVGSIKPADVVESYRLEPGNGAGRGMAIGSPFEDEVGERRLAELFVRGEAQSLLEIVQLVGAQALEIVFIEGWSLDRRPATD